MRRIGSDPCIEQVTLSAGVAVANPAEGMEQHGGQIQFSAQFGTLTVGMPVANTCKGYRAAESDGAQTRATRTCGRVPSR